MPYANGRRYMYSERPVIPYPLQQVYAGYVRCIPYQCCHYQTNHLVIKSHSVYTTYFLPQRVAILTLELFKVNVSLTQMR